MKWRRTWSFRKERSRATCSFSATPAATTAACLMNSVRGKTMVIDLEGAVGSSNVDAGIATWENFPASSISHHGQPCCEIAREWITGMDFSQLNAGHPLTGPRWLRKLFKWGPSQWPMHWCEAVKEKTLDCGELGALS